MRARGARVVLVLFAALTAGCTQEVVQAWRPPSPAPAAELGGPVVLGASGTNVPVLPAGTYVATALLPRLDVWRKPDVQAGKTFVFDPVNPVGQELSFLVTDAVRDGTGEAWLRILVPVRPNGASGWVQKSDVSIRRVREKIVVDLSDRLLVHSRNGRIVHRFSVGIGTASTPTATGRFYVWAQVPQADPAGPYGVFALGLSGFSDVLLNWPGGGRMAIHGTADPFDRGQMVSHGCVRVYNPQMRQLERVPLGTPVMIRP
ncbi:MAG TPA: L,D-transpeptidase [Actinomycetota bacterium]